MGEIGSITLTNMTCFRRTQRATISSTFRSSFVAKAGLLGSFLILSFNLYGQYWGRESPEHPLTQVAQTEVRPTPDATPDATQHESPPVKTASSEAQRISADSKAGPGIPSVVHRIAYGLNDFMAWYAIAKLCGTRDLYTPDSALKEELKATGYYGPSLLSVRLPYYALILSPLARLPYRVAYAVFQALSMAAIFAFIGVQQSLDGRMRALLVCLTSLPLVLTLLLGQDVTFVMLLIAVFLRHWDSNPRVAGAALALCTLKYHLFPFMALVVVLHFRRRMFASLGLAIASLAALSFAVAGPAWPQQYVKLLRGSFDAPIHMPNINAMLLGTEHRLLYGIILSVIVSVVAITALIRCRRDLPLCIAIALMAGILISIRVHVQDCAILLPPLLALWNNRTNKVMIGLVWALLAPVPYLFRMLDGDLTHLIQFCFMAFIAVAAVLGARAISEESPEARGEQLSNTLPAHVQSPALRR
jgi:Glycosyltransferase family 87